jgi:4-hydroxybenzoate polyprenyltransferase
VSPARTAARTHRSRLGSLWRLACCIRFGEVAVLQGAPLLGACFAMTDTRAASLWALACLVAGNVCLVAHVFVLNDWSGIRGDVQDPARAAGTFVARGQSARAMLWLAIGLLCASLALLAPLGPAVLVMACLIAVFSAVYSLPAIEGKGIVPLGSLLHLAGGVLHFLLGFAVFAPISLHGVAIGCYFGLVFTAGHLIHETRDHDADLRSGIRTNAVTFRKERSFLAGMTLFTVSYALLTILALLGRVPQPLALAGLLYPVHLHAAFVAWRGGLTFQQVRRLQSVYRWIHVLIGVGMLALVPPWTGHRSESAVHNTGAASQPPVAIPAAATAA